MRNDFTPRLKIVPILKHSYKTIIVQDHFFHTKKYRSKIWNILQSWLWWNPFWSCRLPTEVIKIMPFYTGKMNHMRNISILTKTEIFQQCSLCITKKNETSKICHKYRVCISLHIEMNSIFEFRLELLNDTHREKLFYSIQYKNGCF